MPRTGSSWPRIIDCGLCGRSISTIQRRPGHPSWGTAWSRAASPAPSSRQSAIEQAYDLGQNWYRRRQSLAVFRPDPALWKVSRSVREIAWIPASSPDPVNGTPEDWRRHRKKQWGKVRQRDRGRLGVFGEYPGQQMVRSRSISPARSGLTQRYRRAGRASRREIGLSANPDRGPADRRRRLIERRAAPRTAARSAPNSGGGP